MHKTLGSHYNCADIYSKLELASSELVDGHWFSVIESVPRWAVPGWTTLCCWVTGDPRVRDTGRALPKWRWLGQMTAHLCQMHRASDPAAWPMARSIHAASLVKTIQSPPHARLQFPLAVAICLCAGVLESCATPQLHLSFAPLHLHLTQRSVASFTCPELRLISALHCACQLPTWTPTLHQPGQPTRLQESAIWRGSAQLPALAIAFIRACLEGEHVQQH